MNEISLQKKQLRREIAAKLRALPAEVRAVQSARIQSAVLVSPEYQNAESIFLYIAMPTEPDTRGILERALSDGKRVFVPKCLDRGEMLAVRIQSPSDLAPGAYGIPEPTDLSETAEPSALDLILVPCVAAAPDGRRLGHGAGYYDRFLAKTAAKTLCLCFSAALSDGVPTDENDVLMDRIIAD